jgi:Zn-finger domain-containing protein
LYIPLQFWFCRNVGLALPLIALQYHEVKVNIEFAAGSEMGFSTAPTALTAELWADYIYLDVEERKRFAQVSHEYLIDQLQFVGADSVSGTTVNSKLNFNHPVKELVWITKNNGALVD